MHMLRETDDWLANFVTIASPAKVEGAAGEKAAPAKL